MDKSKFNSRCFLGLAAFWLTMLHCTSAVPQGTTPPQIGSALDEITVFGSAGDIAEVPGAITYLSPEDLARQNYSDIQRALRHAPGVNIQEEDGYGLRPNIGLRGSGSDRSARITLMEDGILIAPAPYAAPAAYYFPYAARINSVEVTKGTGVILYGPRTTGGAINLSSTPIPKKYSIHVNYLRGSDNGQRLHAFAGGRTEAGPVLVGASLETFQFDTDGFKRIDRFSGTGDNETGPNISDYVIKLGLYSKQDASIRQSLEFKYQNSDETTNETYVGLTSPDFTATPNRRYNGSQRDQFTGRHKTFQASYFAEPVDGLSIDIIGYRTEFSRDWYKLERVSGVSVSRILANPTIFSAEFQNILAAPEFVGQDNALQLRHNNRSYFAEGLQAIAAYEVATGAVDHRLEAGFRWHKDQVDRFQWFDGYRADNSVLIQTSAGIPGTESNRVETGRARAYFIQDNLDWDRFHATIGIRIEDIDLRHLDFGKNDVTRTGDSLATRNNSLTAVSPAFGFVYDTTDTISVLAGVYRGFAPPSPGASTSMEERSTNWEAGFRWENSSAAFEAIAYFNDYSNLLGDCTESTGGECIIGDQFDGGEVDVFGVEVVGSTEAAGWIGLENFISLPLTAVYTLTQTEFRSAFSSGYKPWGDVEIGDALPYVANHQLLLTAGFEGDRWGAEWAMFYQSERRSVAGNGPIPYNERLDPHAVFDFSGFIELAKGIRLQGKVVNVFNEIYIAADRPAGLRPGLPRTYWVGIDLTF